MATRHVTRMIIPSEAGINLGPCNGGAEVLCVTHVVAWVSIHGDEVNTAVLPVLSDSVFVSSAVALTSREAVILVSLYGEEILAGGTLSQ
jgi:hypothetical protein